MAEDKEKLSRPDQQRTPSAKPRVRTRRIPTASTDGLQASSHGTTPSRRRRVYIASDDLGHDTPRPAHTPRPSYPSNRGFDDAQQRAGEQRSRYDERYQAERTSGNYSYNYNRSERPQRPGPHAAGPRPGGKKKVKNAPKGKKPRPFTPPAPIKYAEAVDPAQDLRLNKFLANAGVCSRREADQLILAGEITVNGQVVTELGSRVTRLDDVRYKGESVSTQSKVYILLNKPKNCVTTSDDPECRQTVMDLVKGACEERIYPVGRLDRNTTGVILITNDGDLSSQLTHPSFMKKKIYHVWLDKPVSIEDMQRIAEGIELEDGEIHADALSYVKEDDLSQVGIEIHSGRNRIVRRIFEHLGYHVHKLDRVYFAGLTKKNLPRGRWRYLTEQEVNNLRMGAFE